jgi:hypothetical protein
MSHVHENQILFEVVSTEDTFLLNSAAGMMKRTMDVRKLENQLHKIPRPTIQRPLCYGLHHDLSWRRTSHGSNPGRKCENFSVPSKYGDLACSR